MSGLAYAQMTPGQKAAYTKRMRAAGLQAGATPRRAAALPSGLAEIEALARAKMSEHGLTEQGWTFGWSNAKNAAGMAKFRGVNRSLRTFKSGQIVLSKPIFSIEANQAEALEAILHEIAHALAGPFVQHHGYEWKLIARRIGSTGDRCHTLETPAKFVVDCPCGNKHGRQSMPKSSGWVCKKTKQPLVWRPA